MYKVKENGILFTTHREYKKKNRPNERMRAKKRMNRTQPIITTDIQLANNPQIYALMWKQSFNHECVI